ncbi:MAG: DUF1287 domain-containing protein [Desulfobacteraceae bacterium]|nr:MAG: DUF1287 domain-containing protein [Desulfobacteraceae bacterium]
MEDPDIIELFDQVQAGLRVEVFQSGQADQALNRSAYLSEKILEGAQKQLERPALYTQEACAIIKMDYPWGDISKDQAVCTDIVIRALRYAALDLQTLLHEDILTHPDDYRAGIQKPNYHIDHRRTRNLQLYLQKHSMNLSKEMNPQTLNEWRPGDIVTLDTGIANGTVYDHIGIVDRVVNEKGFPKLINIWTIGYSTDSMNLLGGSYPQVVGHFRMTHPFDYE